MSRNLHLLPCTRHHCTLHPCFVHGVALMGVERSRDPKKRSVTEKDIWNAPHMLARSVFYFYDGDKHTGLGSGSTAPVDYRY